MKHEWTKLTRLAGSTAMLLLLWCLLPLRPWPAGVVAWGPFAAAPFAVGAFATKPAAAAPAPAGTATPAAAGSTTGEAVPTPLPSATEILRRLQEAVGALRDAQARVETEMLEANGRRVRSVVEARVLRQPALVRLQVVEPAALADQVYVVDLERRRVSVYLPVTHQIVVQALDERLSAVTSIDQAGPALWLQPVPSALQWSVRLVGTDGQGSRLRYVLEGSIGTPRGNQGTLPGPLAGPSSRGNESPSSSSYIQGGSSRAGSPQAGGSLPPGVSPAGAAPVMPGSDGAWWASGRASTVRVWVNGSTWLAERLVAYDAAGREVASVVLRDLRVNAGLKPQDLRRLPEDAEVVQG